MHAAAQDDMKEGHRDELTTMRSNFDIHARSLSFVADQPITFLVRHRVSDDKVPAFLLFVEAIAKAASSFPGYVAHTVIPPSTGLPGANRVHTYLSVLKFASRRDFQRWIDSPERAKLLQQAAEAHVFQEIDWDLKEGTLTIINRGLMLEDDEGAALKPAVQEPPKWKFCVLVVIVLLGGQIFDRYAILPLLLLTPLSHEPIRLYLVNTFIIVMLVSYLGLPIASRLVRPLMRPWRWLPSRLSFLYKLEPFRSLSQGLPCFRPPREPAPHVELGRYVRSLEAAIDRVADTNLRLQDRLERLEEMQQGPGSVLRDVEEGQSDSLLLDMEDGQSPTEVYGDHINRPDGLEPTASQVVDSSVTADGADKSTSADEEEGDAAGLRRLMGRHPSLDLTHVLPPNWTAAEKRPMAVAWEEQMGEGGVMRDFVEEAIEQAAQDAYAAEAQVTVVVSVHVPPTQFGRFEDFIRAITKSALLIPGYYGATLIRPRRGACMYVVLHRFQTVTGAKTFARCHRRKQLVKRLLPSLALQPPSVRVEVEKTVLGELFRTAAADSTASEKVQGRGPQRWKMAVVLYLVVVCTQYPLVHSDAYRHLLPAIAQPRPPVSTLLATNCFVVSLVVYVSLPLALVLMQRWVFAPWKESGFMPLRVLQKGLPCLT